MEAPRLTPEAILEVEFREKLRGYNPEDVDRYLEQIATGVRELNARLVAAEHRAEAAESRSAAEVDPESAAARTLVLAQRTADAAIAEAKAEAARIVDEALRDVNQRREQAERETAAEIHRLHALREQLSSEVEALGTWLDGERNKLRETLAATLAQLDTAGPVLSPAPSVEPVDLPPAPVEGAAAPVEPDLVPEPHQAEPVEAAGGADAAAEEVVLADGGGDAFIAELRRAVVDERPLGPREDEPAIDVSDPFEEFIRYAADDDERRGLTSRLRRRR